MGGFKKSRSTKENPLQPYTNNMVLDSRFHLQNNYDGQMLGAVG